MRQEALSYMATDLLDSRVLDNDVKKDPFLWMAGGGPSIFLQLTFLNPATTKYETYNYAIYIWR
jgi:hypothetical protein